MQQSVANTSRQMRIEPLAILGVVVLGLFILYTVFTERQIALRASNIGFDGLAKWLKNKELDAQTFAGGWRLDPETIGLLVVPMFDTKPFEKRSIPRTEEELLLQQDEYDLNVLSLRQKRSSVPTMIILPKWRSGVRLTEIAHPELLVEADRIEKILRYLLPGTDAKLIPQRDIFTDLKYVGDGGTPTMARAYLAQTFTSKYCRPIIGDQRAMMLADCSFEKGSGDRFLLLSDPDLLNNHGLRLGGNAYIATRFFDAEAKGKRIVIDYTSENWLETTAQRPKLERSWSDLMRFFEPPFLSLWMAGLFLLALCIWRGAVRFGPARQSEFEKETKQSTMLDAFSKVMRVSNQNGAMTSEYAAARITAIASTLFGPAHARKMAREENFVAYVRKQNGHLADRLSAALYAIHRLPANASAEQAMQRIDELEQILEHVAYGP